MKPAKRRAPYFNLQENLEESSFAKLRMCCHQLDSFPCSSVPYWVFLHSTLLVLATV